MSRPSRSRTNPAAARAFARVGWPTCLGALHRYATVKLGLPAIDATRKGPIDACDVVDTLSMKVLEGTLPWDLPEGAPGVEVVAYACSKLPGMLRTLRLPGARAFSDDAIGERADPAPDAFERLAEERRFADMKRAFERDAEASAYLDGLREEKKRGEIARDLGMTPEHADVVRKRIARYAEAAMNDDGEDEPPSSGPPLGGRRSRVDPLAGRW